MTRSKQVQLVHPVPGALCRRSGRCRTTCTCRRCRSSPRASARTAAPCSSRLSTLLLGLSLGGVDLRAAVGPVRPQARARGGARGLRRRGRHGGVGAEPCDARALAVPARARRVVGQRARARDRARSVARRAGFARAVVDGDRHVPDRPCSAPLVGGQIASLGSLADDLLGPCGGRRGLPRRRARHGARARQRDPASRLLAAHRGVRRDPARPASRRLHGVARRSASSASCR